ncbi:MAG: hypothetical protein PHT40_03510 [Patescibacteria group bacterium]|nr:hypothetical protein [Patescibacteria group bacterium]
MLKIIQKFLDSRQRQKEAEWFWQNKNFCFLSGNQIYYILDVIQKEVAVSAKFGLIIQPEHLLKEKIIIMAVFNKNGQILNQFTEKNSYNDNLYSSTANFLVDMVCKLLSEEIGYYFDHTPPGEVKNRYNCHLSVLVAHLIRDFVDQKCVPYMRYPD